MWRRCMDVEKVCGEVGVDLKSSAHDELINIAIIRWLRHRWRIHAYTSSAFGCCGM